MIQDTTRKHLRSQGICPFSKMAATSLDYKAYDVSEVQNPWKDTEPEKYGWCFDGQGTSFIYRRGAALEAFLNLHHQEYSK